ncbi:4Fe-4S dicluster domain-containing protein [Candidatus Caldatribacterium sp.]|uniref:4Fe-4S dicluster domain-containing protein n=1 Tax=Candidatus Caldatribacterium sp. TaxID=2282143 RepID=UPI002996F250|nr:4Fe-4S dicluster domain-containing protein [Candidatus Caldatribacterium sp.]MDW8081681.1 4Fe-4S dicluster domain-containing protein [Candidatus Calescibacterium sp.]
MRLSGEGRVVSYEAFLKWFEGKKVFVTETVHSRFPLPFPSLPTPKSLLLPQREVLYRFFWAKRTWNILSLPPSSEEVFLLCAPCEARAVVEVLDTVFLQSAPTDTSYAERRKNLTLVVVGCTFFAATCFCTNVGGHPLSWKGAKGFALPFAFLVYLEGEGPEGRPLEPQEEQELEMLVERLEHDALPPLPEETPERLLRAFEGAAWEEVTWGCLNCGACTFLCPTCFCFDLVPEGKLRGAMVRTWDSCMFPKFTLHASSHNPRPHPMQRVRQRILHKFSYFPLRKGVFGCVGCGRCALLCPVNWDIQEALGKVMSSAP